MAITRIKVSNFKSFDELEVDLRPLNVIVGGNASGKSNFLEIFKFLRDIETHGLENAVSLQGGMEYLANLRIGASRPVLLEVHLSLKPAAAYRLSLQVNDAGSGYEVLEDSLYAGQEKTRTRVLWDQSISVFDFDPKLPKRSASMAGLAELEPDGSNLALVLRNLLQNEESRKSFTLLLRDLLPFVEDLRVDRFSDRSLLMSLKESFRTQLYIPASFLSDGTIQIAALVVALYFQARDLTVLEEPDRNIHPHLISRLAGMLRDVSTMKQLVVTTHNPELVKHTALEDLLLVRRDEQGFSRIFRPAESDDLKVFLENDLGVEDLFVQNLLDIGHGL